MFGARRQDRSAWLPYGSKKTGLTVWLFIVVILRGVVAPVRPDRPGGDRTPAAPTAGVAVSCWCPACRSCTREYRLLYKRLHHEKGCRPRQPANLGKVDPARGCGQFGNETGRARLSAL